jgi:hypothetical protein
VTGRSSVWTLPVSGEVLVICMMNWFRKQI